VENIITDFVRDETLNVAQTLLEVATENFKLQSPEVGLPQTTNQGRHKVYYSGRTCNISTDAASVWIIRPCSQPPSCQEDSKR
jgi:hypothetical protein